MASKEIREWAMVVLTLVAVVISAGAVIQTNWTYDLTRELFEDANRPYLGIHSLRDIRDHDHGIVELDGKLVNFGNLPAFFEFDGNGGGFECRDAQMGYIMPGQEKDMMLMEKRRVFRKRHENIRFLV